MVDRGRHNSGAGLNAVLTNMAGPGADPGFRSFEMCVIFGY